LAVVGQEGVTGGEVTSANSVENIVHESFTGSLVGLVFMSVLREDVGTQSHLFKVILQVALELRQTEFLMMGKLEVVAPMVVGSGTMVAVLDSEVMSSAHRYEIVNMLSKGEEAP
jgi:hypothetical protein